MLTKKELLENPGYLLKRYQLEIYRQLLTHMKEKKLTRENVRDYLGISMNKTNKILEGKFNYSLELLIRISLMVGKVPNLEFMTKKNYWKKRSEE